MKRTKPISKKPVSSPSNAFESVVLLLQGGGALGAYQGGVYQALSEAKIEPNWVAGISIGAINGAIIAGNSPNQRVEKLRQFWEGITTDTLEFAAEPFKLLMFQQETDRQWVSQMSALRSIFFGVPGFFKPHTLPWLEPQNSTGAISFCDTKPLKATLEKLIDFDRINAGETYLKMGAVNVVNGDFVDFDNESTKIRAEHVMASGALPPGFPPVEIDGCYYWDGGLVSNTPLQWLFGTRNFSDSLIFQVDLWSADGEMPHNIAELMTRCKEIQYSSRTRSNTDRFREAHAVRHAIANLLAQLPQELSDLPEMKVLKANADNKVYNIAHLIYHNKDYEGYSKDVEFSRASMEAHWQSGYDDTVRTLKHPEVLQRPKNKEGIAIFDFSREDNRSVNSRR